MVRSSSRSPDLLGRQNVSRFLEADRGVFLDQWRALSMVPAPSRQEGPRAELVAGDVQGAAAGDTATFTWTDDSLPAGQRPVYWLQVTTDAGATDIAMTTPRFESTVVFAPLIGR